jgi:hypothetical protein
MLAHANGNFQPWQSNFESRTGEVLKAPALEVAWSPKSQSEIMADRAL